MNKTKIIVVEDNIVYCEYVCNMLSREGYRNMKAYHLSTAKKHLQQATDNDIVVADLRLPDGSGIDLLCWMRKEGKMQPFIIMTDLRGINHFVCKWRLPNIVEVLVNKWFNAKCRFYILKTLCYICLYYELI